MKVKTLEISFLPAFMSLGSLVFLGLSLENEVWKINPIQHQIGTGQKNRFRTFAAIRNHNGHVSLDVEWSRVTATNM